MRPELKSIILLSIALVAASLAGGCAAGKALRAPVMEPLALDRAAPPPKPLKENHFNRDRIGTITENHLREVLAAPVFLEAKARVGIIQVVNKYNPDEDLPLTAVPAVLTQALEDAALFEVATEVSTDWPATSGIPGLRELAARYRAEYLLLYRHRFVDRSYTNGWGWLYITLIGALAVPSQTLEAAGVVEATLFDVKTGTILFTVFERIHDQSDENIWYNDRKRRELKERMLGAASEKLAEQVLTKTRLLAAARPEEEPEPVRSALRPAPSPGEVPPPAAEPLTVLPGPTKANGANR